jgi:hypothetical protein
MKRTLALLSLTFALTACVDTTGISPDSSKKPEGNASSVVVVTEYADFQCPACRAAYSSLVKPLVEKYQTQVRFDYKHFPLRSLHRYTMDLAEASECAADQGKVLSVDKGEIHIDVEGMTTGVVRGPELFAESREYSGLKIGDDVEATVVELENENCEMELSFRIAGYQKALKLTMLLVQSWKKLGTVRCR